MPIILWAVIAVLAGFVGIWLAARQIMPAPPPLPADVDFPATPLQRAARWSFGVALALAVGATAIQIVYGPEVAYDSDPVRLIFTALVLLVIVTVAAAVIRVKGGTAADSAFLDERDRIILDRASAIQGIGAILTVAAWTMGLTETFRPDGAIPTHYMFLVFWSCVVVYMLCLPLGVLLGYRRR